MTTNIEQAVQRLISAAQTHTTCEPVRDLIGDSDQGVAYQVQSRVLESRIAAGARVVGHKIGLTSRAVQAQLGVPSPDFGALLDDMAFADREPLPLGGFLQPRIEAEVAFVLGSDLDIETANVADVIRATEFVLPAFEIVDSRIADWNIKITDTIADNASSGAFVLGTKPTRLQDIDLTGVGMAIEHRGELVSSGAGAACLGSPIVAVVWLARALAAQGIALKAGQVILSGALGPVVPVTGPGTFHARFSCLGDVTAVFEEGVAV